MCISTANLRILEACNGSRMSPNLALRARCLSTPLNKLPSILPARGGILSCFSPCLSPRAPSGIGRSVLCAISHSGNVGPIRLLPPPPVARRPHVPRGAPVPPTRFLLWCRVTASYRLAAVWVPIAEAQPRSRCFWTTRPRAAALIRREPLATTGSPGEPMNNFCSLKRHD